MRDDKMSDTESFTAVASLIALIVDPKACAARLADLQRTIAAAAKAQAELNVERDEFDRRAAAEKAAAVARDTKLRAREAAVEIAERDILARQKNLADARPPRYPFDPNISGTLTREPYNG
jgi:hypothetical protein